MYFGGSSFKVYNENHTRTMKNIFDQLVDMSRMTTRNIVRHFH